MPGKTLYCLGEAWLELKSPAPLASAGAISSPIAWIASR